MNKRVTHIMFIISLIAIACFTSCNQDISGIGDNIMSSLDGIKGQSDTVHPITRSILVDPSKFSANTNQCYLGSYIDADYGVSTTCDYLTTFYVNSGFNFPTEKQIRDANDGKLEVSNVLLTVYVNSFIGDSITPMTLTYHELDPKKPLRENTAYTTNINPENYLPLKETVTGSVNYTLHDILETSSNTNYRSITDTLDNAFGNRILSKFFENPKNFTNPVLFAENVCPGFYIEHSSGLGAMSQIYTTAIHLTYKYMSNDTIATGVQRIAATDEVIQTPHVKTQNMETLLNDNKYTHLRAPLGVFTEIEVPVDRIYEKLDEAPLNNVRITFAQDSLGIKDEYIQVPPTVMLIAKSKLYEFFQTSQLPDSKTSYLAKNDKTANAYTFSNIANLITWMHSNKAKLEAEFGNDWNKAVLIPVNTNISGSDNNSVTAVHNYYNTSGARLALNPTIYFIYSTYAE